MAVREGLRWLEDHQYIRIQRGRYGGAYVVQPALDVAVERRTAVDGEQVRHAHRIANVGGRWETH